MGITALVPQGLLPDWAVDSPLFTVATWLALSLVVLLAAVRFVPGAKTGLAFAYHCFFHPLGKTNNQSERLDKFYTGQAGGE